LLRTGVPLEKLFLGVITNCIRKLLNVRSPHASENSTKLRFPVILCCGEEAASNGEEIIENLDHSKAAKILTILTVRQSLAPSQNEEGAFSVFPRRRFRTPREWLEAELL
jgi:hypothetical protein